MKPTLEEIPEFYQNYVRDLLDRNLEDLLESTIQKFTETIDSFQVSHVNLSYDHGKWTVGQMVQHIIDAERIFTYRALRFSRNDKTDLPGFDHDRYVEITKGNPRSLKDLVSELKILRQSSIVFYNSLDEKEMLNSGTANGYSFTALAVGYITAGHMNHHGNILKERYIPLLND